MHKIVHRLLIVLSVIIVVSPSLTACAQAPAKIVPEKTNVIVSYCTPHVAQCVAWIAADANLYEKYGLKAETQLVAKAQQPAAVAGGRVDIALGPADMVISAKMEGADLIELALFVSTMQGQFYSQSGIKTAADLKGKLVGGVPDMVTAQAVYALKALGLDPTKDVKWRYYQDTDTMFAEFFAGQIDACTITAPTTLKAKKGGYYLLYDYGKDNVTYPSMSLYSTKQFVSKNRNTTLAVMQALLEAVKLLKTKPDFATDVIMKWTKDTNREAAAEGQASFAPTILDNPKWTKELMTIVLVDELKQAKPAAAQLNPTEQFDGSFMDELERNGFIKQLWGK